MSTLLENFIRIFGENPSVTEIRHNADTGETLVREEGGSDFQLVGLPYGNLPTVAEVQSKEPTTGDILNALGLRVAHFQPKGAFRNSARTTTVVYEPRHNNKHTIRIATAVLSEHDTFEKKVGVDLALRRFLSGQVVDLPPMAYPTTDYDLLARTFG